MTKRLLAAALCAGAFAAGSALAADLPRRAAPPPPLPIPPSFTWTGFYVGANLGYGFTGKSGSYIEPTYAATVTESGGRGGVVGGAQAGYNYQVTPGSGLVLGVETDIQGTNLSRGSTGTISTATYYNVSPKLDYLGTVRARVGYAFDRWLVYGTGGLAYGGGGKSTYASVYPYTLPDSSRVGYTVGGGLEYALTDHISVKLEGLYVNLGKTSTGATYYSSTTDAYYGTGRSEAGFGLARAGVNYRF